MALDHILSEVFGRPLLITPAKLEVILAVLGKKDKPLERGLMAAALTHPGAETQALVRPGHQAEGTDISVISVLGSLVARTHGFSGDSGLLSYRYLQGEIEKAAHDPSIGGIILDMDSYGGSAAGCERLARYIGQVNAEAKPVYAVVDLNCYSACYYLAAACSKIILTDEGAGVGSIGCIAVHLDESGANEQDGLNYSVFKSGAHKDDFSPYKPLSSDEVKMLQRSVDAHGSAFASFVAEHRSLAMQDVLAFEAACFSGAGAIEAGLADALMSFEESAALLADEIETRKRTTFTAGIAMEKEAMNTKERMEKLLAAEDGPQAIAELGYVSKAEMDEVTAALTAKQDEAAKIFQANLQEIVSLCEIGSLSLQEAAPIVKDAAMTVETARSAVQTIVAARSAQQAVKSTVTMGTRDGVHPLVAACQAMSRKD